MVRKAQSSRVKQADQEIPVHYIKSNFFRVIHSDGAHGGITPRGGIQLAFYSERTPIPQEEVLVVDASGKVVKYNDEAKIARSGIVREVEVNVVMNLSDAESLLKFLTERVRELQGLGKTRTKNASK